MTSEELNRGGFEDIPESKVSQPRTPGRPPDIYLDPIIAAWMLNRRGMIQRTLLHLHMMLAECTEQLANDQNSWLIFDSLIGVAFSLWRAVFFVDVSAARSLAPVHAREFLTRLVRDNTVAFQQERDAREWTVGYYLSNAAIRLFSVRDQIPEFYELDQLWLLSHSQRETSVQWDDLYRLLLIALSHVTTSLNISLEEPTVPAVDADSQLS